MKSQTQILSLGLFTKSPISNQTKAIVSKAVIWSSVWSEFASLCELRIRTEPDIYPKWGEMLSDARKEWQPRIAEEVGRNLTLKRLLCFWQLFLFCQKGLVPFPINSLHFISKLLFEWDDEWSQKTFRNCEKWAMYWWKGEAKRFTFPHIEHQKQSEGTYVISHFQPIFRGKGWFPPLESHS